MSSGSGLFGDMAVRRQFLGMIGCSTLNQCRLLVYNSLQIILLAGINLFDIFITQTNKKVCAIATIPGSKFDGNCSRTEKIVLH